MRFWRWWMSEKIEQHLLEEIAELKKRLAKYEKEEKTSPPKPTYSFSKISEKKLKELLNVKNILSVGSKFDDWFYNKIEISERESKFLKRLLEKRQNRIRIYNEQALSMKFISSILNEVDFEIPEREITDFYENSISYDFGGFIFSGEPDFFVAKGVTEPETPYFFIQEFKKTKDPKYPEPQLVAEMVVALEISELSQVKGAFIVGINWHFVILEKVENRYQYFVSEPLLATRIEDLKLIYKNLLFVKAEILEMVDE
jgi:hypothetical protein